jgi:hypothetical protein
VEAIFLSIKEREEKFTNANNADSVLFIRPLTKNARSVVRAWFCGKTNQYV